MATRWAGSPHQDDGKNTSESSVCEAKRKDGRDQSESCPVSPATEEEPFSWAGPKTLHLCRTSVGFGFTLRHFIVYPPESAVHSLLKDEDSSSRGRPRNRLEPMDTIFVKQVKEGGPAHRAGLCTGDRIVKVNGESIIGKTYSQVIALIQNSDASLELCVMPKDEDILQLFSRDITALAYSHDAYLKGNEAYSGNAQNIPEPPPICYPRIEAKSAGMVLAEGSPGPSEALCGAGQGAGQRACRRSNPELGYRMEIPVPPLSPPPSQVVQSQAVVRVYSESARAGAEPAVSEQPPPPTWSGSTPSHRTEENRYSPPPAAPPPDSATGWARGPVSTALSPAAGAQLQCSPSRAPELAGFSSPVQIHSQSYPDVSPTAAPSPRPTEAAAPASSPFASATTSPCSTRPNIDWRNYTTYKEYIDNKRLYMYGCRTIQERLDSLRAAAARGTPDHSKQPSGCETGRAVGGAQLRRRSASHERGHASPAVAPPPRSASQDRLSGAERTATSRDWPRSASEDTIMSPPVGLHKPRARSWDYLGRQSEGGTSLLGRRGHAEAEERPLLYEAGRQPAALRTAAQPHRTASGYAHDRRGGSFPGLSAAPLLPKGTDPTLSSRTQSLGDTAAPQPARLATQTLVPSSPATSYVASALASLHASNGSSAGTAPPEDQRPAANHLPPAPQHAQRAQTESPHESNGEAGPGVGSASCTAHAKSPSTQQSGALPTGNGSVAGPHPSRREGEGIEGADVTVVVLRRQKSGAPPLRHPSYIQAVNESEGPGDRPADTPTCWLPNDSRRDMHMLHLGEQHKVSGSSHLDDSLDSIPFIDEPSSPSVEHDVAHIPACAVISSTPVIATIPPSPTSPSALLRRQLSHDQDSMRLTILESDSGTKTERSKSYDEGLDHFREARGRSIKQLPGLRGLRKAVDRSSEDSGSRRDSSSDVFNDATKEGLLFFRQLNSDKGKRVGSGMRPWKQMYAVLRGCSLYLYKDKKEGQAHASSQTEDEPRPISIKACLIDISYSDTKRKNVLRLTTSDCEYLFQAEDRDDMLSWIRAIQESSNLDEENALITSTDLINRKIKEYNTLMSPSSSKTEPSPKSSRQSLSIRHTLLGGKGENKGTSLHSPSKEQERRSLHKDDTSPPKDRGPWRKAIPGLMRKPFEKKASPGVTFGVRLDDCPPAHNNRFVPLIVEVCCNLVEERGLEYTGIYRVPGNNAAISSMQDELNKGVGDIDIQEDKWKDLNVISSLLKSFFRKLPEPLFTNEKYADFIDANRTEDPVERLRALKKLLHELPDHHYETLKFLSAHLKTVAENSEKNKMEPRNLAIVFGPTLVRTSDDNMTHMVTHMPDQYKIVETLIQHYDWFFTEDGDEEPATSVQQESAVETQPVPNIDHLLTNIGRTATSPGEVSDSPTSDSAKSKGSWGSGKDQYSRELVSSIFAAANRKRKKQQDKLLASSSDDDLDPVFPKKELPNQNQNPKQGQQAAAGHTCPVPHELAAGAKHDGKDGEITPKSRKEHRNSFFVREKIQPTQPSPSPKHSVSPNRTPAPPKHSLSDPPSQVDETTSDLGTMSSGASMPRSRPRRWGTVPPAGLELSPVGPAGASATAEVSSITSDYSTTSSNTFLTGVESSVFSPEVQSVAESRGGDEADDERSELISEGRPMETDSESEFPVFTSEGAATSALDCLPGKSGPTREVDNGAQKPESRRLLPSHKLIECDTLSRRRSLRQKTDSESSVEGGASGGGRVPSRSEPNRLSRVLEAMKKGRSSGSLSSTSSSRSESERGEPARRLKITERLKSHLRSSADDMFGLGGQRSRSSEVGSRKKGVRRRHTMGGQRDFGELAVINDWREQGGPDQGAELSPADRPKPQRGTRDVSIRDWIARERWRGAGSRAGVQPSRSEVKAGGGEALCNPASAPNPQMSMDEVNGGAGVQGKGLTLGTDAHPHRLSGAHVRSRFYQCL
ncbi:rho GTPase-activating protein 21a isoform X3 [Brachyhypopomus gauderio]|uniref:rho GTPase-activating protein 21a isoform X3 n=1 Tax=Brachyhypopomus gauderio TaxID=698409 RepID=UPI0040421FA1